MVAWFWVLRKTTFLPSQASLSPPFPHDIRGTPKFFGKPCYDANMPGYQPKATGLLTEGQCAIYSIVELLSPPKNRGSEALVSRLKAVEKEFDKILTIFEQVIPDDQQEVLDRTITNGIEIVVERLQSKLGSAEERSTKGYISTLWQGLQNVSSSGDLNSLPGLASISSYGYTGWKCLMRAAWRDYSRTFLSLFLIGISNGMHSLFIKI